MKIAITILLVLATATAVFAEGAQILSAQDIKDAIKAYICRTSGHQAEDLLIEYKTPILPERLPQGSAQLRIKTPPNAKLAGFTSLHVSILLDEKAYKEFMVYVEVDVRTKAYMAKRWIKRYEPLDGSNIEVIDTYRSKIPLDAVSAEDDLSGRVTKIALGKGRIITRSIIEEPPIIKNKELVAVILEGNNLRISAKGVALNDAKKNEMVKLRLVDSKKDIYGRALGPGVVSIEMQR